MPGAYCNMRNITSFYIDHTQTYKIHTYTRLTALFQGLPGSAFCFSNTHTHLMALWPGLPGRAGTRKVTPIWILLKQETVSGSGISWAICKSASCSRQITTPASHHSFLQADALPAAQPTASKHWRGILNRQSRAEWQNTFDWLHILPVRVTISQYKSHSANGSHIQPI